MVFVCVLGGFIVNHEFFDGFENDATVLNMAGRQRMLSQRIVIFAHEYIEAENERERITARFGLSQSVDLMETSHKILTEGSSAKGIPEPPKGVQRMLFAEPGGLDLSVRAFLSQARELLDMPVDDLEHAKPILIYLQDQARSHLIVPLNQVVDLYEVHYHEKADRFEQLLLIVALSTGVLIVFIGLFIFMPIVERIVKEREKLQKTARELSVAKQEAGRTQAMKDQFLSVISHELNTPLYGILGAAQVLQNSAMDETAQKFVDGIISSSQELERLVGDLIELSRLQGGDVKLTEEVFDLVNLLQSKLPMYRTEAEGKGLIFEEQLAVNELMVQGDPLRISRIIHQLVSNALKFTTQGRVDISLSAKEISGDKVTITLQVADTGVGIPKEKVSAIYNSFHQVENTLQRKHDGLGIGLTMVHQLVQLMNGSLGLESTEGKGSTFTVNMTLKNAAKTLS
jgi:signal transduction histidine kinase